ncbi:MAG: hypothetical protein M3M85_02760 [bacterium]|nr:hypothetical protein [bacterium]
MKEPSGEKILRSVDKGRNLENFNHFAARHIILGTPFSLRDIEIAFRVNWGPELEEKLKGRFEYTRDAEGNFIFTKDKRKP